MNFLFPGPRILYGLNWGKRLGLTPSKLPSSWLEMHKSLCCTLWTLIMAQLISYRWVASMDVQCSYFWDKLSTHFSYYCHLVPKKVLPGRLQTVPTLYKTLGLALPSRDFWGTKINRGARPSVQETFLSHTEAGVAEDSQFGGRGRFGVSKRSKEQILRIW